MAVRSASVAPSCDRYSDCALDPPSKLFLEDRHMKVAVFFRGAEVATKSLIELMLAGEVWPKLELDRHTDAISTVDKMHVLGKFSCLIFRHVRTRFVTRFAGVVRTNMLENQYVSSITSTYITRKWSEWRDSNSRPSGPKPDALPDCATLRRGDGWGNTRFTRSPQQGNSSLFNHGPDGPNATPKWQRANGQQGDNRLDSHLKSVHFKFNVPDTIWLFYSGT